MITEQKTIYKCEHCTRKFDDPQKCLDHELFFHKCLDCKHNYFLYGSEQLCDLGGKKKCKFEKKTANK